MRTLLVVLVALNCCLGQTPRMHGSAEAFHYGGTAVPIPKPHRSSRVLRESECRVEWCAASGCGHGQYLSRELAQAWVDDGIAKHPEMRHWISCRLRRSSRVLRDRCRRQIKECSPPNYCDHLPDCEGMLISEEDTKCGDSFCDSADGYVTNAATNSLSLKKGGAEWVDRPGCTKCNAGISARTETGRLSKKPRSRRVLRDFQRQHPCPANGRKIGACPGFVKDHVIPLCAGGPDVVPNLQWQSVAEAKAKDRLERKECTHVSSH